MDTPWKAVLKLHKNYCITIPILEVINMNKVLTGNALILQWIGQWYRIRDHSGNIAWIFISAAASSGCCVQYPNGIVHMWCIDLLYISVTTSHEIPPYVVSYLHIYWPNTYKSIMKVYQPCVAEYGWFYTFFSTGLFVWTKVTAGLGSNIY